MAREKRVELIKQIEEERNSKVICYVTSDRKGMSARIAGDIVPIVHKHAKAFAGRGRISKLDLFLYSRGGQSDVPWALVSLLRELTKEGQFSVLVPFRCHSAATMICLGADEIVMSPMAELGPIDITMENGPYNPRDDRTGAPLPVSVEDVRGYFGLQEKLGCDRPSETSAGLSEMSQQVHPLALGRVYRLLEQTKLVALRLLNTRSRAKCYTEEKNEEIVQKLSSEMFSHRHVVRRTEARESVGLRDVRDAEEYEIEKEMWQLFEEYQAEMKLLDPFRPEDELEAKKVDEREWTDLVLAVVESKGWVDRCLTNLRVRRLRDVPPKIELSLGNIGLPNLPDLPDDVGPQGVQQILQSWLQQQVPQLLNGAAKLAVEQLVRSLPSKGLEKTRLNPRWESSR